MMQRSEQFCSVFVERKRIQTDKEVGITQKPSKVEYEELIMKVQEYYKPQRSIIVECYKFYTQSRYAGESVTKFIAELWLLSKFCEFGGALSGTEWYAALIIPRFNKGY